MRKRALLSGFYCPDLVLCQKQNIWKIQINPDVNFFTEHRWIGLCRSDSRWVWTSWKCAIVDCFFSKRRSYIFVFKLTRKLYLLIHSIKRLCNIWKSFNILFCLIVMLQQSARIQFSKLILKCNHIHLILIQKCLWHLDWINLRCFKDVFFYMDLNFNMHLYSNVLCTILISIFIFSDTVNYFILAYGKKWLPTY